MSEFAALHPIYGTGHISRVNHDSQRVFVVFTSPEVPDVVAGWFDFMEVSIQPIIFNPPKGAA